MNKRLRKFERESKLEIFGLGARREVWEQALEKYAELILQDIDRIVDDLYHAMPLEQAAVLLTLDENIKQHFYGVEE